MTENETRSADVNLARIASALERIATVAERTAGPDAFRRATTYYPSAGPETVQTAGTAVPPPEPRREFQFSASAGARLREGEKHDPDHKGVKPGRSGLYCPTKLGDGTWCQWRQAA